MQMKTEISKIIEAGLDKNTEKVRTYANHLSEKLMNSGEEKFAEKIKDIINNKAIHPVHLDEFMSKPTDKDSKIAMVEVLLETEKKEIIFDKLTQGKVDEYISFLTKKDTLISMGVELPESLLLYGPPGCGKTSVAEYIAHRSNLPLVTARLDGIISSMLGSTAKNIGRIFEYAEKRPCILFLDEFDAIAKARNDSHEVGELKRVVNSLLQNIDAFNKNSILIAATNHADLLDPAVWRRFSNTIEIPLPEKEEIIKLLKVYLTPMENSFLNDANKINIIAENLSETSPSFINTICFSSIKRAVIRNEMTLSFSTIMYQIYVSKNMKPKLEDLVYFLNTNGVSQANIANELNISIRIVKKMLNLIKEGELNER